MARKIEEDDDSPEPKKKAKGMPMPLIIAIVAGVVVLGCGGVSVVAAFVFFASVKPVEQDKPPGDMSLKEFILQKPSKPTAVQVDCKLSTYYNYSFSNCAETHYSFDVNEDSPSYASAHAYAPKTSDYGKRLYEQLKSGRTQKMTLRLQRVGPNGNALPANDDSCFALIGVVDAIK